MTIHDIKYQTQETAPYFFSRDSMRFFGQTMRSFRVETTTLGGKKYYRISAPMKDSSGKRMGQTVRYFDPETRELLREDELAS